MPFIQLQFRRGTATQWTSANPVLADGELAIESDTSKFKIGNGFGSWNFLPYGGLVGPTGTIGNTVSIDISFNGNIFVGRDVSFGGNLTVRNDVSFNKELRVGGNINIRSGAASISSGTGALIVAGGVGVGGNLNVALDASFNNRLFVNKDVSFGAKLCVQSDVSFNGNTSVALLPFYTGNATITPATNQLVTKKYVDENGGTILLGANNVWTANNTFNGNTSVAILPVYTGNATITPAINQLVTKKYVDENGGTILLSGNNTWTANNTFNGSRFYVNADASFQNKLTVGDDVSLNARLFVGQDSSLNGNVFVRRNLVVGGDASFNDNMSVQSDSSFNNRLYVGRQIGVGVTANASYALDVLGNINLSGNLYLNHKLFSITSADISLNANLMVGADASFNGNVFMSKTLNLRKTVITGAATGSPTSIAATTAIVEITGSGASTAYFNLLGGSYAGQTLTIISATNGGGGGLYVNAVASNIIFNGSNCSQMRFSSAFQTVYLVWSSDVSDWIVTSWQGVNFGGVSMNFGTYTSGDITLGAAGRVNINPSVGGMVVGSDSSLNGNLSVSGTDSSFNGNLFVGRRLIGNGDVSFNQRLTVGGADSSFNGNLYTGGYINAEGFIERFVNVASSSGTYTADFNNGIIIYVNAFSGSSTPTLSITNLPTVLNQSYVFTVVYSGLPTSTYFSALNINGVSVPVSGSVSLTAASSYYVHQFCIFFTDATNLGNNFVVQNFNSSAPLSLVSPLVSGNLSVNGNINLTGGNIFQNGVLFSGGGGGGVGTTGNSLSLSGNLYVGGDVSFNNRLTGNGDVSLNQRLFVGGDVSFGGNLVVRRTTVSTGHESGALIVAGGVGVAGVLNSNNNINTSGVITTTNSTVSTGTSTGAIVVNGGVGVGGNLWASRINVNLDSSMNGNLRIGATTASTSTSTGALIVSGGVGVGGDINGITVGRGNGNYTNNTVIGLGALASVTTGLTSSLGDFNTAVGTNALNLNANGFSNSAFGVSALLNNTTGFRNVAIGLRSHETNTTGINNVAIGYEAGRNGSFTTTSFNTFLGSDTNITGNFTQSTAIGVGAQITLSNQIKLGRDANTEYVYCGSALRLNPTVSYCDIRNLNIGQNLNFGIGTTDYLTVNASGIAVTGNGNVNVGGKVICGTSASNTLEAGNLFVGLDLTNNTGIFNTGRSVCINFNNSQGAMNRIRSVDLAVNSGSTFQTGFEFYCKQDINFYKSMQIYSTVTGGETASNNCDVKIFGTLQAISFNATSDYRIKQNVHSLCEDASFNVDVLKPVSYINTQLGKSDIGFIAHEVQEHYPYLVNGVKDGESMQTLNYTGIIGILTKEVQELKKKDAIKEQRIQDLEKMVLDILANK